jgi:sugar/nucleoside kinase (ribokinase family)
MSLLVTGSIGIDTVETPAGKRDSVLGGSAVYFSYASSFFTPVRLVGVVGEDVPEGFLKPLEGRPIDTAGLEVRKGSKTFRWHGSYVQDLNEAKTVEVDLNVLAEQAPKLPAAYLDSEYVFLANTHPELQLEMLKNLKGVKLAVADTMNLWIEIERKALLNLLKHINGLVLNDAEARMLTGTRNLVEAARQVLAFGDGNLKFVVIKKGEHGSLLCYSTGGDKSELFALPAFPTATVVDPTGAGDSFAGGMMGYLATHKDLSPATLKRAVAYGTVVASFTISDFSLDGLSRATKQAIDGRYEALKAATAF